jgi:hypothetical protein
MIMLPADGPSASLRPLLVVTTTLLAVAAAVRFRWLLGAWLMATGIALNLLPILANGGLMPVAWETVNESGEFPQITVAQVGGHVPGSKDILLPRDEIRLEPLTDRFVVDAPFLKTHVYSPGDFVLFTGIALAALELAAWIATGSLPANRLKRYPPAAGGG